MDKLKLCVDGASWCIILASWAQWLPYWAAGLSAVWTIIQLYTWWKNTYGNKR